MQSKNAFTGLRQRTLTAVYYGPISLLAIFLGPFSTLILLLLLAYFTGSELEAITSKPAGQARYLKRSMVGWVCLTGLLVFASLIFAWPSGIVSSLLIGTGLLCILWLCLRFLNKGPLFHDQLKLWISLGYIVLPLSLFYWVGMHQGVFNYIWLFVLLSLVWVNDSVAFFTGKMWGRTALASRISPNKTWEGTIGGWLACVAIAVVWSAQLNNLNTIEWLALGLIIGPACTLGDLIESKFKRDLNLKDSGTSFPGHGGFLDRLDSLLFSTPIVAFYLWVV